MVNAGSWIGGRYLLTSVIDDRLGTRRHVLMNGEIREEASFAEGAAPLEHPQDEMTRIDEWNMGNLNRPTSCLDT